MEALNRSENNSESLLTNTNASHEESLLTLPPPTTTASQFIPAKSISTFLFISTMAQYVGNTAFSLYLVMQLNVQPDVMVNYWIIVSIPGWFNPIYGAISDGFVCWGYRRIPTLVIFTIMNSILWGSLALLTEATPVMVVGFFASFVNLVATTTLNALLVEEADKVHDGAVQGIAFTLRCTGSLLGSVAMTVLLLYVSNQAVMWMTAVLYVMCAVVAMKVPELKMGPKPSTSTDTDTPSFFVQRKHSLGIWMKTLRSLVQNPNMMRSIFFVFMYTISPDISVLYFSYISTNFMFSIPLVSTFSAIGLFGGVVGSCIYYKWCIHWKLRSLFTLGTSCYLLAGVSNLLLVSGTTQKIGIPNEVFIPVDQFFTTLFARLSYAPVLQLASETCPAGMEAFVFELFSCVSFAGGTIGGIVVSKVSKSLGVTNTEWGNFWILIVMAGACRLVSLLFVLILPKKVVRSSVAVE
eukprot:PhF_6_TR40630/c1_g1_i2/m.60976